jgi:hypothetical protein
VEATGDRSEVGAILNDYLLNAQQRIIPQPFSPNTYKNHEACISDFCNFEDEPGQKIGRLTYRDLKVSHIERWVAFRTRIGRPQPDVVFKRARRTCSPA